MNTTGITTALLAFALSTAAVAQQTDDRLGDHPAVIVKRLYAQRGYDYASKVYPHPAWLYLHAESPRPLMEHPADIVFRRQQHEELERAATSESNLAASLQPK